MSGPPIPPSAGILSGEPDPRIAEAMERLSAEARRIVDEYAASIRRDIDRGLESFGGWGQ